MLFFSCKISIILSVFCKTYSVSNNLRHNFKKSSNFGKNLHFQGPVRANWSINRAVQSEEFFISAYLTISRVSAWFWEFTSCFRNMKNVLRCILSHKKNRQNTTSHNIWKLRKAVDFWHKAVFFFINLERKYVLTCSRICGWARVGHHSWSNGSTLHLGFFFRFFILF